MFSNELGKLSNENISNIPQSVSRVTHVILYHLTLN